MFIINNVLLTFDNPVYQDETHLIMRKQFLIVLSSLSLFINNLNGQTTNSTTDKANKYLLSGNPKFEENKGQISGKDAADAKFVFKKGGLSIFVMKDGLAYQFNKTIYPEGYDAAAETSHDKDKRQAELSKQIKLETYRMNMRLQGANPDATIISEGKSKDYAYFYGTSEEAIFSYSKITYKNVYPNIDWVIYTKNDALEYDFVIKPGGNPNDIKIVSSDVEQLSIKEDGSLHLGNRMGNITEKAPFAFQGNKTISTRFALDKNSISFHVADYNPAEILVIDPQIEWATYYGGSTASSSDEQGFSTAIDRNTNDVYLAGWSVSNNILASGGFQSSFTSGMAAFLVKFNSAGQRLWATYYGTGFTRGRSCAVDAAGNVYMCGRTDQSANTGNIIATTIAHQPSFGGGVSDAYLVKFNSAGQRLWATFYGNDAEDTGEGCATDAFGNVYMTGHTFAPISGTIDNIGNIGFQNSYGGGSYDGFLVKFNGAGVRQWGTFYGGNGSDEGLSCCTDAAGNVYLGGTASATINPATSSTNLASNGFQNTHGGTIDGFLAKFDATGNRLWATYYGGAQADYLQSCNTDAAGNVYIAGFTKSPNLASTGAFQTTMGGTQDAFMAKFDANGARLWATYYGGSSNYDEGHTVVIDPATNNVYLSGYTASTNNIATGGFQNALSGGYDAFLTKFDDAGQRIWGTYYGGTGNDQNYASAVDNNSAVYLAGYTKSASGIASGGFQNTFAGGGTDGYLAKISPCSTPVITVQPTSYITCDGDTAMFKIKTSYESVYQWQVNNGSGFVNITNNGVYAGANNDSLFIYNAVTATNGYTYRCLVSSDPNCPTLASDEASLTVNPSYHITNQVSVCYGETPYNFEGQNITQTGNYVHSYQTAKGCDSTITLNFTVGAAPVHGNMFTVKGCGFVNFEGNTYNSNTILTDTFKNTFGCDSLYRTVAIVITNPSVDTTVVEICQGDSYSFDNQVYNASGVYTNTYVNADGCDSIRVLQLTVNPLPVLEITTADIQNKVCFGDVTELEASGASVYEWTLNQSDKTIPGNPYKPRFTEAENFIQVKGTDNNNCSNTTSITIQAQDCCDVILVPNAFSPNGDGLNDKFGVQMRSTPQSFKLTIFNRWGQLIFESGNINQEWDGTFKGQMVDPGNYFYMLQFECINDKVYTKKGDITLIR